MNVLISLHRGYGLGDAVQMSAVLRHVAKYRPHWHVDYQAEEGRHQAGRGIVANTFARGEPYPSPHYDAEVEICLYDTWANWHDRPNTRVSSCLHERFGLGWDPECGRYRVDIRTESTTAAHTLLYGYMAGRVKTGRRARDAPLVAIHYRGDSSPEKKNLSHAQADGICRTVESLGAEPIILDWRRQSPLAYRRVVSPQGWGGDAEMVCAIISQCAAFIGIDSGPSKCASATDTPSLVIWTGHHPAPFHDPAPNTTHLVPRGYHGLEPVCNDPGVIEWFEEHYNFWRYNGDLTVKVRKWLEEVLQR
jgi:hypothetical protein